MKTDQSTIDETLQRIKTKTEINEAWLRSLILVIALKIEQTRFTADLRKHQEEDSSLVRIKEIISNEICLSLENKKQ